MSFTVVVSAAAAAAALSRAADDPLAQYDPPASDFADALIGVITDAVPEDERDETVILPAIITEEAQLTVDVSSGADLEQVESTIRASLCPADVEGILKCEVFVITTRRRELQQAEMLTFGATRRYEYVDDASAAKSIGETAARGLQQAGLAAAVMSAEKTALSAEIAAERTAPQAESALDDALSDDAGLARQIGDALCESGDECVDVETKTLAPPPPPPRCCRPRRRGVKCRGRERLRGRGGDTGQG